MTCPESPRCHQSSQIQNWILSFSITLQGSGAWDTLFLALGFHWQFHLAQPVSSLGISSQALQFELAKEEQDESSGLEPTPMLSASSKDSRQGQAPSCVLGALQTCVLTSPGSRLQQLQTSPILVFGLSVYHPSNLRAVCVCVCVCVSAGTHECTHTYMSVCVYTCLCLSSSQHCPLGFAQKASLLWHLVKWPFCRPWQVTYRKILSQVPFDFFS